MWSVGKSLYQCIQLKHTFYLNDTPSREAFSLSYGFPRYHQSQHFFLTKLSKYIKVVFYHHKIDAGSHLSGSIQSPILISILVVLKSTNRRMNRNNASIYCAVPVWVWWCRTASQSVQFTSHTLSRAQSVCKFYRYPFTIGKLKCTSSSSPFVRHSIDQSTMQQPDWTVWVRPCIRLCTACCCCCCCTATFIVSGPRTNGTHHICRCTERAARCRQFQIGASAAPAGWFV